MFQVSIETGNAAMFSTEQVAAALRATAARLERDYEAEDLTETQIHTQTILDLNGNRVGGWKNIVV